MANSWWLVAAGLASADPAPVRVEVPPDGSLVEVITAAAVDPDWAIFPADAIGTALLGRVETRRGRIIFHPALPFLPGQRYCAQWQDQAGLRRRLEFTLPAPKADRPSVTILPRATLPANAVKIYLQFSHPMEQGIFLDRLRLLDSEGQEIPGPFRETELWSPDGTRLTVWLHPGRQKSGVNLNIDEGPVLRPGGSQTLVVAGSWRDTNGLALGEEIRFPVKVGPVDHESPVMSRWQISIPRAGTYEALTIKFDESLDPAMLRTTLSVANASGEMVILAVEASPDGRSWSAVPEQPWEPGDHELWADPSLEDLAGNSLARPFEVDLSAPKAQAVARTMRRFEVR